MAGWISPEQCTSNCCGPPTPCPPPIVTCRLYVDGYGGGSGFLAYTVENADRAWVRQACSFGTTEFELTLTDGAASGNYAPIIDDSDVCRYTIFAENSCATVAAICWCDVPYCELTAERVVNGTTGLFESVRLRWRYRSRHPSVIVLGNPIVSADLSGIDVFGNPHEDTGDEFVLEPFDLQESYTLTVTNDCGEEVTCTVNIPCCWRQSLLKMTISGVTDISETCTQTGPVIITNPIGTPVTKLTLWTREYEITGLSGLNGTHFLTLRKFDCLIANTSSEFLGTVHVRERAYEEFERLTVTPGVTDTWESVVEYDIDIYTRQGGTQLVYVPTTGTYTCQSGFSYPLPFFEVNGEFCMQKTLATPPYSVPGPPCDPIIGADAGYGSNEYLGSYEVTEGPVHCAVNVADLIVGAFNLLYGGKPFWSNSCFSPPFPYFTYSSAVEFEYIE